MDQAKGAGYLIEMLRNFDANISSYELFCQTTEDLIRRLILSKNLTVHSISGRCKDRGSFEKKIQKKGRYKDISEITDLAGIRIITNYSDDVDVIASLIEKEFDIDKSNSIDKRTALDPDRFGYLSLHYVASLKSSRSKLQEYAAYDGLKVEVQIRSILQHTWAEIEHDIGYKNEIEVPSPIKRKFSRLAGLLELADQEFISIRKEIDKYTKLLDRQVVGDLKNIGLDSISYEKFLTKNTMSLLVDGDVRLAGGFKESGFKSDSISINRLMSLGVTSIAKLLSLLRSHREDIKRMVIEMKDLPGDDDDDDDEPQSVGPGIGAFYLCHVIAAKLGREGIIGYAETNGWLDTPGGYEFVDLLDGFFEPL